MIRQVLKVGAVGVALAVSIPAASAEMVQKFDLAGLIANADRVFRGTVIDVEQGTIAVGGGELPAVTYQVRVEEMLKGTPDVAKDGLMMVEMQMIGTVKDGSTESGGFRHFRFDRDEAGPARRQWIGKKRAVEIQNAADTSFGDRVAQPQQLSTKVGRCGVERSAVWANGHGSVTDAGELSDRDDRIVE